MRHFTLCYHTELDHGFDTYIEMRQAVTSNGRYEYRFDLIRDGNVIADCMNIDDLEELRNAIDNAIVTYGQLAHDIEIGEPDEEDTDHE